MKLYLQILSVVLICLFVFACAQMKVPTGGPKDTTPPKALGTFPANQSTNFKEKQVQILFDEYFDIKDPSTNVVISPPMDEMPTFSIRGKKLFIKFNEPLKENTTYNINLGTAIVDITENNAVNNFQYVFSTGEYIDSLEVTGVVVSANDNTAQKDILVMLYKDLSDTVVATSKPYYFAKTENDGSFHIHYVGAGTYKLFALEDKNSNLLYDLNGEAIAFWPEPIVVSGDSGFTLPKIQLQLFTAEDPEIKLIWNSTKNPGLIQLAYNKPIEKIELVSLDSTAFDGKFALEENTTKDTITYWYTNIYKENPSIVVVANDTLMDTLIVRADIIDKDNIPFEYLRCEEQDKPQAKDLKKPAINWIGLDRNISLTWPRPIKSFDTTKLFAVQDSSDTLKLDIVFAEGKAQRVTELTAAFKQGSQYDLYVLDNAFTDEYGISNKAFPISYKARQQSDYGNINLQIDSLEIDKQYLIKLLKDDKTIEAFTINGIEGTQKFDLKNLLPGKYKITITYDTNKNGKWDSGDHSKGLQPERTYQYPDGVDLKANWDVEVAIAVTR